MTFGLRLESSELSIDSKPKIPKSILSSYCFTISLAISASISLKM
jgi:hypothetical protein